MAISTVDGLMASAKQRVRLTKTASFTTVAAQWSSTFDVAGEPGAGSLAIGNTTNGVVPTDATAGFPAINAFGVGNTGYLAKFAWGSSVACRLCLFDRLWHAGSINLNAAGTTSFTAQPSYLARTIDGTGVGVEIWLEINTTVSATATTVTVTYTNSDGTAGRTTASSGSLSGFVNKRLIQLPLQAGDKGVQKIDSVIVGGTVASAGTFNVIAARSLFDHARVKIANDGDTAGWDLTLMPEVFEGSALWLTVAADSTASGLPDVTAVIANG